MYFFTLSLHLQCDLLLLLIPSVLLICKFFHTLQSLSFQCSQSLTVYYVSLVPSLCISSHLHTFSCCNSHTYHHYFHFAIMPLHVPLSDNSFLQCLPLTAVPYSASRSLTHVSVGMRTVFLKPVFNSIDIFLLFITVSVENVILSWRSLRVLFRSNTHLIFSSEHRLCWVDKCKVLPVIFTVADTDQVLSNLSLHPSRF